MTKFRLLILSHVVFSHWQVIGDILKIIQFKLVTVNHLEPVGDPEVTMKACDGHF